MKITQVEIFEVTNPNTPNWHPVLIRIDTDEGISGVGEVGLAYCAVDATQPVLT